MNLLLGAIALALGFLRLHGMKSALFQGVAHIYVGGLFGYAIGTKKKVPLFLALALTLLEIFAFLWFKRHQQ